MWNPITANDVQSEVQPDEAAALALIQNSGSVLPGILANAIALLIDSIRAGNYAYLTDGTVPDGQRADLIAIARYRWFASLPQTSLASDARKKSHDDALDNFKRIAEGKRSVEPPTAGANPSSGQWQSENKLIMRAHPVPDSASQFQSTDITQPPYANPNGPQDT